MKTASSLVAMFGLTNDGAARLRTILAKPASLTDRRGFSVSRSWKLGDIGAILERVPESRMLSWGDGPFSAEGV